MSAKHTPGPWTVERNGLAVSMANQVVIVCPAPDGAGSETEKANARLIAAAPELLEHLKTAVAWLNRMKRDGVNLPVRAQIASDFYIATATALLAKIEGVK